MKGIAPAAAQLYIWALVLLGGLIAVPVSRKSAGNRSRIKAVYSTAAAYCVVQLLLFAWILGPLRSSNQDWAHGLMLPFLLGLALPIIMGVVFWATRGQRHVV